MSDNNNPLTFQCAQCGVPFPTCEIQAGKCVECYEKNRKRKLELEKEGFYDNMSKLGSWKVNSNRGKK